MHAVTDATYLHDYVVELVFSDGRRKRIDFSDELHGQVFEPLRDVSRFRMFTVNHEIRTIAWDTGADFCPDVLYDKMGEFVS